MRLVNQKVIAFADDCVFFITSSEATLPNRLSECNSCGELSSFKINLHKLEALNITLTPSHMNTLYLTFPFHWVTAHITYLGTKITLTIGKNFATNVPPLFNSIKGDLRNWHRNTYTRLGINTLKK